MTDNPLAIGHWLLRVGFCLVHDGSQVPGTQKATMVPRKPTSLGDTRAQQRWEDDTVEEKGVNLNLGSI